MPILTLLLAPRETSRKNSGFYMMYAVLHPLTANLVKSLAILLEGRKSSLLSWRNEVVFHHISLFYGLCPVDY